MNELTNAEKIQVVMNTLETLDIKPTFDNANKLLGVYRFLAEVRDNIQNKEEDANDAGEADAE